MTEVPPATGRGAPARATTATITCCQLTPRTGDLAGNERLAAAGIRAAVDDGADVVVLPELVTSGYPETLPTPVVDCGIDRHHQTFATWADCAGDSVVVGGFCERAADGRLHNSVAVVDATGVLAIHRKTHLWGREQEVFVPGSGPPVLVDTPVGRLGVLICYEMEFPEMTRAMATAGAELLAVPANWPLVARPAGERPPEVGIAMAAARVNRVAIACCDRGGTGWTGGSTIIGPDGWIAASAKDGIASTELDLSVSRDKSLGPDNDALRDRRPELYGSWSGSASAHRHARGPTEARGRVPLVLLPGMLGGPETWDGVAGRLVDVAESRVSRIDLDDSIQEMAATVLAGAPARFALAGHSLGGIVALELVRRAPDRVTGLALLNTSARGPSDDQHRAWAALRRRIDAEPFSAIAADLARSNLPDHRRDDGDLVALGEVMAQRVGPDGLRRQLAAQATRPESRPSLPAIAVSTIVVSGASDQVCAPNLQEELAEAVPGARHVVLPDTGHMAPMEDAETVATELRTWLAPGGR